MIVRYRCSGCGNLTRFDVVSSRRGIFTTKHRGTGLGLPTAKRVIEQHGGSIDVQCPPTGGTVVTVSLPLDSQTPINVGRGL